MGGVFETQPVEQTQSFESNPTGRHPTNYYRWLAVPRFGRWFRYIERNAGANRLCYVRRTSHLISLYIDWNLCREGPAHLSLVPPLIFDTANCFVGPRSVVRHSSPRNREREREREKLVSFLSLSLSLSLSRKLKLDVSQKERRDGDLLSRRTLRCWPCPSVYTDKVVAIQ